MILEANGFGLTYGHGAELRNVSFSLDAGEMVVLLTTALSRGTALLEGLMGLARAPQGSVRLAGEHLTATPSLDVVMRIGRIARFAYRERGLVSLLDVHENIALPLAYHHRVDQATLETEVWSVAEMLDIDTLLSNGVDEIDAAETRLVNLARALISRPKLVLIDGLFEGITPGQGQLAKDAIQKYRDRDGFGVVLTAREDGYPYATRVYELEDGGLR